MTRAVDAGRLRHRVTFQVQDPERFERDSDGAIVEEWTPLIDRPQPCEITPASGRELFAAAAAQSKVTHRLKARFRVEFESRFAIRGLHRGTVYTVEAVAPDPDSGRRYVTLFCSSGVRT